MGTAPAIWNTVLRLMVDVVPRKWWSSRRFSEGLARFLGRAVSSGSPMLVGESHAMRVDVSSATSAATVAAVQRHDSFRTVRRPELRRVLPRDAGPATPGIALPEELYADAASRERILARLEYAGYDGASRGMQRH